MGKNYDHLAVQSNGYHQLSKNEEFPRTNILPAGIYSLVSTPMGKYFKPETIETDEIITLEESVADQVTRSINHFLTDEVRQSFKDYKFMYRRGILLFGPPGTGKTSTVVDIARSFVKNHNGIVVLNPYPNYVTAFVKGYREIEADRKFMVVFEEIDDKVDEVGESPYLALLDGENSVDNTIYLATTNYIDNLAPRFKNRPSRFADVIEVGFPSRAVRKAYLEKKILPKDKARIDIDRLADSTENFTIDHLKDLIVTVCCLRLDLDTAVRRTKEMIAAGADREER